MNYEFSMEKRTAVIMLAGLTVVGLLLFAAGVIVGLQLNQGRTGLTEVADASGAADDETAKTVRVEPSPEPVMTPRRRREEPGPSPAVSPAAQTSAPQSVPEAGSPATGSAKPAQDRPPASTQQLPQQSSQPNYSVSISPGAAIPDAPPARASFAVQVGAFLREENALRLRDELERKGYSVSILSEADGASTRWYAVRLGPYKDQTDARRAADKFTQQEKMKAIVRPSGVL